jgi:hypothetical protein
VADSLDEAKAAFRAASEGGWVGLLSGGRPDEKCSTGVFLLMTLAV